ncbi:TetR/AcrR family transcriptional regulator [Pseudoalteromonas lipolytica]|uniref:TetR/AcrR family transcriptional regulator n=1 Tax=Pseudoalteromonas lipolytica TaxID=570156 RepID=A0ABU8SZ16_9GAMM
MKRVPKQDRSGQTKAKILSVAREHFSAYGYDASNIRDIAKSAGTTHAMITYHFGNKDALWKDTITDMFKRLREVISFDDNLAKRLQEPEQLKYFIKKYIMYCANHPEHARIMLAESIRGGERLNWMVEKFIRPAHKQVYAPALRKQIKDGVLPEIWEISLIFIITTICQIPYVISSEINLIYGVDFMSDESIEKHTNSVVSLLFPPH